LVSVPFEAEAETPPTAAIGNAVKLAEPPT
jgi:hypothetical protein